MSKYFKGVAKAALVSARLSITPGPSNPNDKSKPVTSDRTVCVKFKHADPNCKGHTIYDNFLVKPSGSSKNKPVEPEKKNLTPLLTLLDKTGETDNAQP